jgi:predicted component of type VI protein secretion system
MPFRLRYLAHDLELPVGEFVVGRSTECQLSLDDPLVSRRHAVLKVGREGVTVQDLGSRNGVIVNGAKIEGVRELSAGDKIAIGSQEMFLQNADEPKAAAANNEEVYRRATQTLGAAYVVDLRAAIAEGAAGGPKPADAPAPAAAQGVDRAAIADPPTAEASRSLQSFQLLGGVADKALAMNRAEDAERILQALLLDVMTRARDGQPVDASMADSAAKYAARLGGATTRGTWVDYVFELYKRQKRTIPAAVVDELYTVVRKAKNIDLTMIRGYLAEIRGTSTAQGPADQFLIKRIEGLERLVALK